MERLFNARVAVFGIGGVGGYTVEALARSGIGTLDLIDDDRVCLTNLNRQLLATRKTVGQYKVDVAEQRIHEINPDAVVHTYKTFYTPQTADCKGDPNYELVEQMVAELPCPVIAEGRVHTPEQAKKMLELGAWAVVVGGAITRPLEIATRFMTAVGQL